MFLPSRLSCVLPSLVSPLSPPPRLSLSSLPALLCTLRSRLILRKRAGSKAVFLLCLYLSVWSIPWYYLACVMVALNTALYTYQDFFVNIAIVIGAFSFNVAKILGQAWLIVPGTCEMIVDHCFTLAVLAFHRPPQLSGLWFVVSCLNASAWFSQYLAMYGVDLKVGPDSEAHCH